MKTEILATVEQVTPSVLGEGAEETARMSKLGQLFTADWKMRLILAGRAYRMSWGTATGGTDAVPVGAGTVVNLDQPQGLVVVDSGYLIPMEIDVGLLADLDAANDQAQFLVLADRSQAVAAGVTGTVEVPDNLLDGGPAFSGRAWSIVTADVTDPTPSDILYYQTWFCRPFAAATQGVSDQSLKAQKEWSYPTLIAGPCSIYIAFGGVVAVTGIGSFVFAHIPATWAPVV